MAKRNVKPTIELNFINLNSTSRGGDEIKIMKTGIYLGPGSAEKLGVKHGDYIMLAEHENKYYMGKRPKGVFGGAKLSASKNKERPFANIKPEKLKLKLGTYEPGEVYDTQVMSEQGHELWVKMHELNLI